ncbi:MAG: aminomethyl-transferring glycine dehydrogenase [Ignavibacteriaceae bacterium]
MKLFSHPDEFVNRHIGPSELELKAMLQSTGVQSLDQLVDETIPKQIRLKNQLQLDEPLTGHDLLNKLNIISKKNKIFKSYIGFGYYPTISPEVIKRNILENPGWYTQYTPYQAEISQGRLEALLNFQTMVNDLTGMSIANASLLDEGTSAAEAMIMFHSLRNKTDANKFFISNECFPQTIEVLKTRSNPLEIELVIGNFQELELTDEFFGILVQYPSAFGEIYDYRELFKKAKAKNIFSVVAADIFSLALLTPPGEFGADAVVGSTQRFGIPMGFGGPHAAYFATKDEFKRQIPGRIIGISVDSNGNRALRMALQTREQHIRREKATSNICTSQVLLAIMASMYAVYHGPNGIKKLAERIHLLTKFLEIALTDLGFNQSNKYFFDTLNIKFQTGELNILKIIKESSEAKAINFHYTNNSIQISLSELTGYEDVLEIIEIFSTAIHKNFDRNKVEEFAKDIKIKFPAFLERTSEYLQHPVFNSYHSETEMLRYMKSLEDKDLSLTHSMIPLGSCTMKLNATVEMVPVTWSEFSDIHPFAPLNQAMGYLELFKELENDLEQITGFSAISLQPNSGAQGEYTGLMVIREYYKNRGEKNRNITLIPSSAHGTNPASAVMAGMKVVVVNCDNNGNVDLSDLKKKAELHKINLAALMITYPSTHGVFEEDIKEICKIIHDNGGQVYMDGANMNAQVGLTSPAMIGADVCHLNLHKTFCIPHGGGGPGVGPIGVASHLVPFLPVHPVLDIEHEENPSSEGKGITAVASAPWGSAGILVVSYAYIKMMGAEGLAKASKFAILNANYIKARLENHFKVLYAGKKSRVAHELIFDMRSFKISAHIEVEDIAKRLMDYGYHAPTVSFPVAGTLMIEPTESESKRELDRFCDALISIRQEINEVEIGIADVNDNVLKNSPYTLSSVVTENWNHPYSREKAAFPMIWTKQNKFWPSVARVNNAYGDRNLVCSCAPISDYMEEAVS